MKRLLLALVLFSSSLYASLIYSENFEKKSGWKPREGIKAEQIELDGRHCLHVEGRQEKGWNYVTSPNIALEGNGKYRLEFELLVKKAKPQIAPYFKMEFISTDERGRLQAGKELGRANSGKYSPAKGGWQKISTEFACPEGANGGWFALEKGTNEPVEIDACIANVSLEKIAEFSFDAELRFAPVPEPLNSFKSTHPRLYLTDKRLKELKDKIKDEPYSSMLQKIKNDTDGIIRRGPSKYVLDDGHSGNEQFYQRDMGNVMPHIAILYLLTGDEKYLQAAKDFMLASVNYPTWGAKERAGNDLAAGHQLYGLALGYDWLYRYLDDDTRKAIKECLLKRGKYMYERLARDEVWWSKAYLQNRQWVNMTGLSTAGFALFGEADGLDGWILLPLKKYKITMASLGSDGASHEGVPYWTYGVEYMMKFMDLAKSLLNVDLFRNNKWFENTSYFRLYSMLPFGSWKKNSTLMTFADGPRMDWYGPDYLLRKLASEYRNPYAQWLAEVLDNANLTSSREAGFLNLLWYDEKIEAKEPADLPTFRYFDDLGIYSARSGWGLNQAVSMFKCGPYIGHHALQMYDYDPGGGHVHPDSGSFQIFAFNDWLIVDDGYAFKQTEYQNISLVNGIGQIGEGIVWFNGSTLSALKRAPKIIDWKDTESYDYVTGDLTPTYKDEAGLESYIRHFIYLKPSVWIVIDEFEAKKPSLFKIFFHSDYPFIADPGMAGARINGKNGALCISSACSLPVNLHIETIKQEIKGIGGKLQGKLDALVISNEKEVNSQLFVTVLEAYPSTGQPITKAEYTEIDRDKVISVQTGNGKFFVRLREGKVEIQKN